MDEMYYETNRDAVLYKWLRILFWLIVPSALATILSNKSITGSAPTLNNIGQLISILVAIAYGIILLKLGYIENAYRTAGICNLIYGIASVLVFLVSCTLPSSTIISFLNLPGAIMALVGIYYEFKAHSNVLKGTDDDLSEKWSTLWKVYLGLMIALFASAFIAVIFILFAPILTVLFLLAIVIGICVVNIIKLVYLYKTSSVFLAYSEMEP